MADDVLGDRRAVAGGHAVALNPPRLDVRGVNGEHRAFPLARREARPGVRGVLRRVRPAVHPDHPDVAAARAGTIDLVGDQLLRVVVDDLGDPHASASAGPVGGGGEDRLMLAQRVDRRVPRVGPPARGIVDWEAGVVADPRAAADRVVSMVDVFVQQVGPLAGEVALRAGRAAGEQAGGEREHPGRANTTGTTHRSLLPERRAHYTQFEPADVVFPNASI